MLKLRFGDVAYALRMVGNMNPLRNWLRRGQVAIEGGYGDKRAEFTFRDLIALAIIQRLVEYNVGVERAGQLVDRALNAVWHHDFEANPCLVYPIRGLSPQMGLGLPARLRLFKSPDGEERIEWGTADHAVDADTWIVIDVHKVLSTAVSRALISSVIRIQNAEIVDFVMRITALDEEFMRELKGREEVQNLNLVQRAVQTAMRDAGVAIDFAADGTVNVLADKRKAALQKRPKKKAKS